LLFRSFPNLPSHPKCTMRKKLLTLLIEPIGAARQTGPCDRLQTFYVWLHKIQHEAFDLSLPPLSLFDVVICRCPTQYQTTRQLFYFAKITAKPFPTADEFAVTQSRGTTWVGSMFLYVYICLTDQRSSLTVADLYWQTR
jgi:hypothetical protein